MVIVHCPLLSFLLHFDNLMNDQDCYASISIIGNGVRVYNDINDCFCNISFVDNKYNITKDMYGKGTFAYGVTRAEFANVDDALLCVMEIFV